MKLTNCILMHFYLAAIANVDYCTYCICSFTFHTIFLNAIDGIKGFVGPFSIKEEQFPFLASRCIAHFASVYANENDYLSGRELVAGLHPLHSHKSAI